MKETIKVGFCIAYDWYLLEYALPLIYKDADLICLSIDSDRMGWAGMPYTFDQSAFDALLKRIDVDHKIKILEGDYHQPHLSAGQNEVRQRNLIAEYMGKGGWHIQLDCDEYFYDFPGFVNYLRAIKDTGRTTNVCCPLLTLYKQVSGGFLSVYPAHTDQIESIQIATRQPLYEYGRRNGYFNLYTNFVIIHQSWARPAHEVMQKLENWGHKTDFNGKAYFDRWMAVSDSNYTEVRDFHPIQGKAWPALKLLPGATIPEVLDRFRNTDFISRSSRALFFTNSIWFSRLRRLFTLRS